jgi:heme o synthase
MKERLDHAPFLPLEGSANPMTGFAPAIRASNSEFSVTAPPIPSHQHFTGTQHQPHSSWPALVPIAPITRNELLKQSAMTAVLRTAYGSKVNAAVLQARVGTLDAGAASALIHDLVEFFKLKVVALVLVTSWGGYYLGSMLSGVSSLQRSLLDALLGIGMVSAAAGALNEVIERKTDALMVRTANRPMAAGRFSMTQGLLAATGALILGMLWLYFFTNQVTAALALLTVFTYVAVYTPLKRVTPMATFIGAFPGAMGPMLGWTATRARIEWPALALFAILFVWQFPHFMSIAWLYRKDYSLAGIRMLPVVQPRGVSTIIVSLFFAVLMIPVSLAPCALGMAGIDYAVPALALGLFYLFYTVRFARIIRPVPEPENRMFARDLLKVSVLYLPLLFTTLMLCAAHAT